MNHKRFFICNSMKEPIRGSNVVRTEFIRIHKNSTCISHGIQTKPTRNPNGTYTSFERESHGSHY
jgi:hypothetical protein